MRGSASPKGEARRQGRRQGRAKRWPRREDYGQALVWGWRDKLTAEGVRAGRCYKSRTRQPALYPLGGYLVRG